MTPLLSLQLLAATAVLCLKGSATTLRSPQTEDVDYKSYRRRDGRHRARLPFYMDGKPQRKYRDYQDSVERMPHVVRGDGLSSASTGSEATFTIQLVEDGETEVEAANHIWDHNVNHRRFIYVWIAGEDQVLIAEVTNNGDGTLTATYKSDFPGDYLIYIEDIDLTMKSENGWGKDNNRPVTGSPFRLTISGPQTLDLKNLPACSTLDKDADGEYGGIAAAFWKKGTWISSNVANAERGVLRSGWVFQPQDCVHETFRYHDIMTSAALEEETWVLVLGTSILRGVFSSLIDLALAQGQKTDIHNSKVWQCWGWVDIRIGSLRITYQDMRLWYYHATNDKVVCHNEKLASDSTASYVQSAKYLLENYIFGSDRQAEDGGAARTWPTMIVAPSHLAAARNPNLAIEVTMNALPQEWDGTLLFLDHMAGFNFYWNWGNPTVQDLDRINPTLPAAPVEFNSTDFVNRMEQYQAKDGRVEFISAFPMYQTVLWENMISFSRNEKGLCFGCDQHFHFIDHPVPRVHASGLESYSGSKMVHSELTEMVANIVMSKALGGKQEIYQKAQATQELGRKIAQVRSKFEICADCPRELLPVHVKSVPEPECEIMSFLQKDPVEHDVWNKELCPSWCMAMSPVGQTPTNSGPVDVRECVLD